MKNIRYSFITYIVKFVFFTVILGSFMSCTEEDLIPLTGNGANNDSTLMNIKPRGYYFVLDDMSVCRKPEDMLVLIDRAINSWRGGYIQEFVSSAEYHDSVATGKYLSTNDSALTAGKYNFMSFTYDTLCYDYSNPVSFVQRQEDLRFFDLAVLYKKNFRGIIENPSAFFTGFIPNYNVTYKQSASYIDDYGNPANLIQIQDCKRLTQRCKITFNFDLSSSEDTVMNVKAYLSGIVSSANLYYGNFSCDTLVTVKSDSVTVENDTLFTVDFDIFPIIRPSDLQQIRYTSLGTNDANVNFDPGYVYLNFYLKNKRTDVGKQITIRHKLSELNGLPLYNLSEDATSITLAEMYDVILDYTKNKIPVIGGDVPDGNYTFWKKWSNK